MPPGGYDESELDDQAALAELVNGVAELDQAAGIEAYAFLVDDAPGGDLEEASGADRIGDAGGVSGVHGLPGLPGVGLDDFERDIGGGHRYLN